MKWVYPVWLARGASKGSNLLCHKLNQLREYVLGQTLARKKFSAFFPVYTVWSATPTIYALSLASIHPQIAFPLIPSPLWLHRFIFSLALLWWSHSPAELDLTAPKFLLFLCTQKAKTLSIRKRPLLQKSDVHDPWVKWALPASLLTR